LGYLPVADNLERNLSICRTAYLFYGLIKCQPLNWLVIEMGDNVIRLDPSLCRRRVIDDRYDLNQIVLHPGLNPNTTEWAYNSV
jgi:hypothetical protein